MILNGREVKFFFSVAALTELQDFAKNKSQEQLIADANDNATALINQTIREMVVANRSAIMRENFESGKKISEFDFSNALTEEEIRFGCSPEEFTQLSEELGKARAEGMKRTVEVDDSKKKER